MIRSLLINLAMIAATVSFLSRPVMAQSREGSSALTIERPLTIVAVRAMTFGRVASSVTASASGESIVQVTGDPGRIFRVGLPDTINADDAGSEIGDFTIWSDNAGEISRTLTAYMDSDGIDRLHVAGVLRRVSGLVVTDVIATIPLRIDYE